MGKGVCMFIFLFKFEVLYILYGKFLSVVFWLEFESVYIVMMKL